MRIFRTAGVAVAAGVLAACAGPVLSSAPAELKAQAESGACQEAARISEGLVLQELAEAYAHRPSDEAFITYMGEWLGRDGFQLSDAIKACLNP